MAEVLIAPRPAKAVIPRRHTDEGCAASRGRRHPIIILPGIARSSLSTASLRRWLRALDFEVVFQPFPWRGTGDLRRNAALLRRRLQELKVLLQAGRLLLVCQGESGLIFRYCMEKLGWLDFVQRAVFLGTPMRGTRRHLLTPLPRGCRQVAPASPFIRELMENEGDPRFASRYVSIYSGRGAFLLPGPSGELDGALNMRLGWPCPDQELARSRRVLTLMLPLLAEEGREAERHESGEESLAHLRELDRMVRENPDDPQALIMRGRFFLEKGCSQLAIRDLGAALRVRQELPEAYLLRALAYRRLLRFGENPIHNLSLQDLSRAIRLRPGFADAYFQRGVCYALLGMWEEAMEDWDHALILNRDHHAAYLARGLGRMRRGESRSAREDFLEVLRLHPDNPDALRLLREIEG